MNKYYDYFPEQDHVSGEVSMNEFIAEAMRTDIKFKTLAEELQYQRTSRTTPMDDNWNRRNRDNMDRLKTGTVDQVAGVVRNLMRVDKVKKLSTGEKKLLNNARQILIGEIALVEGVSEEEAAVMIDNAVG